MDRIGIAGLGKMGAALARVWAGKGHAVTGWRRSGVTVEQAQELGISEAPHLADLAAASDVIVTSLSDDAAVIAVLGVLATHELGGKLVVETSTVSPETIRNLAPALEEAGARVIDAPISGGPEMVAAGSAGFFTGGAEADVAQFRPLADLVANRWFHAGGLGQGLSMKIVNNMVISGYIQSLADGLAVGARAGLTLPDMIDNLLQSPAASGFLKARAPAILGQDDSVGFAVAQAVGDQEIFVAEAERLGVDAACVRALGTTLKRLMAEGHGELDISAVARLAGAG